MAERCSEVNFMVWEFDIKFAKMLSRNKKKKKTDPLTLKSRMVIKWKPALKQSGEIYPYSGVSYDCHSAKRLFVKLEFIDETL